MATSGDQRVLGLGLAYTVPLGSRLLQCSAVMVMVRMTSKSTAMQFPSCLGMVPHQRRSGFECSAVVFINDLQGGEAVQAGAKAGGKKVTGGLHQITRGSRSAPEH